MLRRWGAQLGILVACATGFGGPGWALPKADPPQAAASNAFPGRGALGLAILSLPEPLEGRLRLTAEQKARWTELRNSLQRQPRVAVRPGTPIDPAAGFVRGQAAQRKAEDEALGLLIPEQRKAWERMKQGAQLYEGFGRAGLGLLMVDGISPEQKAKFQELVPQALVRRKELLLPQPRGITRAQIAERVRNFDIEVEAVVRRMLAPEQALQFDAALPLLPYPGN